MPSEKHLDDLYMDIAERVSNMSHARRKKVGAVIANDTNILSYGWNGTPAGDDNNCEIENSDGTLTTKSDVLHAESNALAKIAGNGGTGARGATLYVTMSPCFECAKLIKQTGIARVVFREQYRINDGPEFLRARGIICTRLLPPVDVI